MQLYKLNSDNADANHRCTGKGGVLADPQVVKHQHAAARQCLL